MAQQDDELMAQLQAMNPNFTMQAPPNPEMDSIQQAMEQSSPVNAVNQMIMDYAPMAGEIGGALYGSLKGAKQGATWSPIPQLKVPSAVVGGVVGAMTGRGIGETAADLAGDEVDVLDTLGSMLEAGAYELGGAAVFGGIAKGYRAIKNYRAGKELGEDELKALVELQQYLQTKGITLTPAQITNSGWQTNLEKVAIAGIGGETQLAKLYKAQNDALKQAFEREVQLIGRADRVGAGEAFQGAIKQVEEELIAWAKPQYKQLDAIAGATTMSAQSLETYVRGTLYANSRNIRANRGTTASISDMLQVQTRLPKEMENELKLLLRNERTISFKDAFSDIERLSTKLRELKLATDKQPKLEAFYSNLIDRYHTMLDTQAKKQGSDIYQKYKGISDTYREGMQNLRSEAVKSLADKAPEAVAESIWATGNVSLVHKAYNAIDDAALMAERVGGKPVDAEALKGRLKAGYLDNLFRQVQSEMTDSAADKASTIFGKIKGDPKYRDTFKAVLTKEEQAQISKVLGWAESLEKSSGGNFSLIVRGKQSAGIRTLLQGAGIAGAAGTSVAPASALLAIGAVMTPPVLARWAVSGKASNKALKQMQGLVERAVAGKWDRIRDGGALVTLMGTVPLRDNETPPEYRSGKNDNGGQNMAIEMLKEINPTFSMKVPEFNQ